MKTLAILNYKDTIDWSHWKEYLIVLLYNFADFG